MRYVTSIEQLFIEKGVQQGVLQGRQEGRREGRQEGRQQGEATMLRLMLIQRFGELSAEAEAHLKIASEEQLQLWGTRLFSAETLDDLFRDATH